MKNLLRTLTFVALTATVLLPVDGSAQSYTEQEKEVWRVIEGCWEAWDGQNDLDTWSRSCWHDKVTFFSSADAAPFGKDWPLKAGPLWFERNDETRSAYYLRPLAITVVDDVAVVHYFARGVSMVDGEAEDFRIKRTETLIRQNGTWKVLGIADFRD